MKKFAILIIPFMLNLAHGQSPGHDAAYRACENKSLSRRLSSCVDAVTQGQYFDVFAAMACERRSLSRNVTGCIKAITNKRFSLAAIDACEKTFSRLLSACLKKAGRLIILPAHQEVAESNEEIAESIRTSLELIQQNHILDAAEVLYELEKTLRRSSEN